MKLHLYIKFNEIKIAIFHKEIKILEQLYILWSKTLDDCKICNNYLDEDTWIINIENKSRKNFIKNKKLYYYNSKNNIINFYNLIKEFIVKISLIYNYSWIHASALEINKKAVIIVGNKNSGKTTSLLRLLKNSEFKFLGNDQIPIIKKNNAIYTRIWRPDIKIRGESLKYIDKVRNNKKTYISLLDNIQILNFNFKEYFEEIGKKVYPIKFPKFRIANKKNKKIALIIVLSDYKFKNNEEIINYILKDKESIEPEDLNNWNNKKDYWKQKIPDTLKTTHLNTLKKNLKLDIPIIALKLSHRNKIEEKIMEELKNV